MSPATVEALERWARLHFRGDPRAFAHALYDRRRVRASERIRKRCGGCVRGGPFTGMAYPFAHRDAGAKCIGSYESELHTTIEQVITRSYRAVVNLGCAEGYYAVGLARRMATSTILAVDYNPRALALCRRLAVANGIADGRIRYAEEANHTLLDEATRAGDTFVLADVEGSELWLLDPVAAPTLAEADLLVELHEHRAPGVESVLRSRFASTHKITAIDSLPRDPLADYAELGSLRAGARALALRERAFPMRWLLLNRDA